MREYVSKLSADGVTKCLGPDKCPVGGNHGGNGTEKSIGCTICKAPESRVGVFEQFWRK